MQKTNVGIDMLFEVSWEVCNKVGGISSFLRKQRNSIRISETSLYSWVRIYGQKGMVLLVS